jgi:hypothetical protein
LKQGLDGLGYLHVSLCLHGKKSIHKIHHLMADAFLPPKGPTDTVVRHLNDIKTDNRPCNLARGTHSDNAMDAFCNGKWHHAKGVSHGSAKLTEDQVREIRRLYATGVFTQQELALRFGVDQRTVSEIIRRKIWKHVV